MLKIFSIGSWLARDRSVQVGADADGMADGRWLHDPLAHPALRSMSPTEIADLPIGHPILCESSRTY